MAAKIAHCCSDVCDGRRDADGSRISSSFIFGNFLYRDSAAMFQASDIRSLCSRTFRSPQASK